MKAVQTQHVLRRTNEIYLQEFTIITKSKKQIISNLKKLFYNNYTVILNSCNNYLLFGNLPLENEMRHVPCFIILANMVQILFFS